MYLLYKHQWNSKWAFARKLHIFTHENTLLPSHVKRSPSLWLRNKSHLFHWCLYSKQNITCPLVDMNFIFMFNSISYEWAVLTREISSGTLEDKIHIHARACNIYANPWSRGAATLPCCRSLVPRVSVLPERPWERGCCCPSSHTIISCLLIFSVSLPLVI